MNKLINIKFNIVTLEKRKLIFFKMVYDFKKEEKKFYRPKKKPELIKIPKINFLAVRGKGNPNVEDGEYQKAIAKLYSIAFTIRMSKKSGHDIDGYFEYVVPPLEGLWWMDGQEEINFDNKDKFKWISLIRLPDFVTKEVFDWAIEEATNKKNTDFSSVEFLTYDEGEVIQCMHVGSYDEEKQTINKMYQFAQENNLKPEYNENRKHHEIYLSDPRRTKQENLKTIIRIPVKRSN